MRDCFILRLILPCPGLKGHPRIVSDGVGHLVGVGARFHE